MNPSPRNFHTGTTKNYHPATTVHQQEPAPPTLCLYFFASNDFIQKQHYELQREVLIDRNTAQYKNVLQPDKKETYIDHILRPESDTETAQADHMANIKAKDNHRSDKKSNNSNTSVISEKKNIVILCQRVQNV